MWTTVRMYQHHQPAKEEAPCVLTLLSQDPKCELYVCYTYIYICMSYTYTYIYIVIYVCINMYMYKYELYVCYIYK